MVVYNVVTLDSTGQVLRFGSTDFENDGTFDSDNETFHSDIGHKLIGVSLKYTKVVDSALVEMTSNEKTAVDDEVPKRDVILVCINRGVKETLSGDGAISVVLNSTKLTKGSEQAMTLADGGQDGLMKVIRTDDSTSATITCDLDQDIGSYISFSMDASGRVNLTWFSDEGYWDVSDYKQITFNT